MWASCVRGPPPFNLGILSPHQFISTLAWLSIFCQVMVRKIWHSNFTSIAIAQPSSVWSWNHHTPIYIGSDPLINYRLWYHLLNWHSRNSIPFVDEEHHMRPQVWGCQYIQLDSSFLQNSNLWATNLFLPKSGHMHFKRTSKPGQVSGLLNERRNLKPLVWMESKDVMIINEKRTKKKWYFEE